MWIAVLVALFLGFLGGLVYSAFMFEKGLPLQTLGQPQQAIEDQGAGSESTERIEALEIKASLNPKNVEAWVQLGNLYFDNNMHEKAISAYKKSLELYPNNADVWTDIGVMYRRSARPFKAIEAFDKAMAVDPEHETSHFNKGIVFMYDLGEPEKAISVWEDLLTKNPTYIISNGESLLEIVKKHKDSINQ